MAHSIQPSRISRCIGLSCPYCGIIMNTMPRGDGKNNNYFNDIPSRDHVNPRIKGGGPTIIVCIKCNGDKDNLSLIDWSHHLIRTHDPRAKIVAKLVGYINSGRVTIIDKTDGTGYFKNPIGLKYNE